MRVHCFANFSNSIVKFNLFFIVLVAILIVNSNASFNKTLYSDTQSVNSVLCISVSYFFSLGSVGNLGHLLIVKREVNNNGFSLESDTQVDKIPLIRSLALNWNQHLRTIYFYHPGTYVISVIHNQPTDIQSTAILLDVTFTEEKCPHESLFDYPTDLPMIDLPSTPIKVESTTHSTVTESKSTIGWSLDDNVTASIHESLTNTNEPTTTVITSNQTKNNDENATTLQLSSTVPSFTDNTVTPVKTTTKRQTIYSTKLDTITIPTGDSPVTTDYTNNSYSSTEPTVVSTTINDHVDETSTKENQSNTPTIIIIISTTTTNYDGQMFKNSTAEESFSYTDSTQLTTTIKDSSNASIHSDVAVVDTANDTHEAKTGNFGDDLIVSIQLLTKKRYSIPLIAGVFGLIIMMISVSLLISRHKSQDYQIRKRGLIISTSSNGIDLNTIKIHSLPTN